MTIRHRSRLIAVAFALLAAQAGIVATASAQEITGAAILEHPCGQVSVKHMGLVHEGRMDEALQLSTPDMQAEWNAMPAEDQTMISGMLQAMSQSAEDYAADVEAYGVLVIDGEAGTLTLEKVIEDASGTSTMSMSQGFQIDGDNCAIAP
jgi:hypothetical protein